MGIQKSKSQKSLVDEEIVKKLIEDREIARKSKNYDEADLIRQKLKKMNIEIEDSPDGTKWFKIK